MEMTISQRMFKIERLKTKLENTTNLEDKKIIEAKLKELIIDQLDRVYTISRIKKHYGKKDATLHDNVQHGKFQLFFSAFLYGVFFFF